MRADCHMHTYFSGDSEAKPEDMVLAAIDKGLEAICFTDHEDIDYFCDDIEFVFDPETYFKELGALKEKYKEKPGYPDWCGVWTSATPCEESKSIYRGKSV